jgi:hypothetical protein
MNEDQIFTQEERETTSINPMIKVRKTNSKRFKVWYGAFNPATKRFNQHHFIFTLKQEEETLDEDTVKHLAEMTLQRFKPRRLLGMGIADPYRIKPREVKTELSRLYEEYKNNLEFVTDKKIGIQEDIQHDEDDTVFSDPTVFEREADDSGQTVFLAGKSFSGKTFKTVQELNKILQLKRGGEGYDAALNMYSRIFIMTTSPKAQPWRDLQDPDDQVRIIPFYLPKLVKFMKKINDNTDNAYPVLLILDDVFSSMKVNSFKSLILTLRNSNISTVVLSQAHNHLTPDSRSSIHKTLVTGFNENQWIKFLGESFLKEIVNILIKTGVLPPDQRNKIANRGFKDKIIHLWTDFVGSNIVYFDNKRSKVSIIKRDPF